MKKLTLILCLVLILVLACSAMALARTSDYLRQYDVEIIAQGNGAMLVEFSVRATGTMDDVGVSKIFVEKKVGNTWQPYVTYFAAYYPSLMGHNRISHLSSINFFGTPDVQYRATITAYAADNTGSDDDDLTSLPATCY